MIFVFQKYHGTDRRTDLRTYGPTDRRTNGPTDGRTRPSIEMRSHIEKAALLCETSTHKRLLYLYFFSITTV